MDAPFLSAGRNIHVPLEPTAEIAYRGLSSYCWRDVIEGRREPEPT